MGDFGFRKHRFTAMRLYLGKRGVDIIGSEIDQQAVALVLDRSLSRRLDKTSARAALGLELHIVVHLVSFDLPAKNIAVELPCCAGIRGGDLDMHDWMACYNYKRPSPTCKTSLGRVFRLWKRP